MEKNYDPMKICGIVMMVYGVLYALLGMMAMKLGLVFALLGIVSLVYTQVSMESFSVIDFISMAIGVTIFYYARKDKLASAPSEPVAEAQPSEETAEAEPDSELEQEDAEENTENEENEKTE